MLFRLFPQIAKGGKMTCIIKVREDIEPISLNWNDTEKKFEVDNPSVESWYSSCNNLSVKEMRNRIEPWLTALFQSEHLSLLVGSGLTTSIADIAGVSAAGMKHVEFDKSTYRDHILNRSTESAKNAGRSTPNIEDDIRSASELLAGLKILGDSDAKNVENQLNDVLTEFAQAVLKGEGDILSADEKKKQTAFNYLVSFLMSFASRSGTRDRLQIFTTNYDRIIEEGADLAGLHLIDRFVGFLNPIFRSSRLDIDMHYNPPGIRGEPRFLEGVAKFTKLHGSIDWIQNGDSIRRIGLPLGAEDVLPFFNAPGFSGLSPLQLMIYPNSAKDKETSMYPYVDLFRDFASAICRPNSTIITFGYSFGNDHINRVIKDMLTIPSTHLMIIAYGDPQGRIMDMYNSTSRKNQISLLIGEQFGALMPLVDNYLPKSSIDRNTSVMYDILKSRHTTDSSVSTPLLDPKSTPSVSPTTPSTGSSVV